MRVDDGGWWRGGVDVTVRFGGRERVRMGTGGRGLSLYSDGLLCGAESWGRGKRDRVEVESAVFPRDGRRFESSHCLALFKRWRARFLILRWRRMRQAARARRTMAATTPTTL